MIPGRGELICDEETAIFGVGYINQLNSQRGRKNRNPIGFAPPATPTKRRRRAGARAPGSFPAVEPFEIRR